MMPVHKKMLTALAIILVGWGAAYYFLIMPKSRAIAKMEAEAADLKNDLRRQGVSQFDPGKLNKYKEELRAHRMGLNRRFRDVYLRAVDNSNFGRRVTEYDSIEGGDGLNLFRSGIDQITYQTAFLKLKTELAKDGIHLYEPILSMSEDSNNPLTYQLMAHLWIIEDLTKLAKTHDLDLRATSESVYTDFGVPVPVIEEGERRPPLPARIRAMDVGIYRASDKSPPYMEEYPVKLQVSGTMKDVTRFLEALTTGGNFLPLSEFAVTRDDTKMYRADRVEATIVCSGFLILGTDISSYLPDDSDAQLHNLPPYQPGT